RSRLRLRTRLSSPTACQGLPARAVKSIDKSNTKQHSCFIIITMRIPEKATTLSGAWRPRDPVDDDQGGARA
ncbi:MAG: hypothetical protein ABWZ93_12800, partial [Xanthobacteraceae bacterium]